MDRRSFISLLASGLLPGEPVTRPNFLFVLADDLGWRDFGIYGSPQNDTPEIDRLAREGVRFSNAYAACPVCSPTRASILTGKYPARLHLTDWIPGRAQWPSAKLLTPEFEQGLPLSQPTIAERLKPLGYRTAAIGKWHLGGGGLAPAHRGFDVAVGGDQRGGVSSYFGPFTFPALERTGPQDYITDLLTGAAEAFLADSARRKVPFFLYFSHYAVHAPIEVPKGADTKYRAKPGLRSATAARYAALVETVDVSLGRLRRKLDELGLASNTIVIVTSDNGGLRYEGKSHDLVTDNSPLRAGKGHVSLWYAQRWQRFFAVFHAHTFIGMIESDDGLNWRRSAQFELTKRAVVFEDGEVWTPERMERPFVLADAQGVPQILYVACKKGEHSLNLALPIRTQP